MSTVSDIEANGLFIDLDLQENNNILVLTISIVALTFWFSTNYFCPIPYSKFAAEDEIERKFHQQLLIKVFRHRVSPRLGWVVCYSIPAIVPAIQFGLLARKNLEEIDQIAPSKGYALTLFIMWELSFVKRVLESGCMQVYSGTFPALSLVIITGGYTIFGCCAIHMANQVVGYDISPDSETFAVDVVCIIGYSVFFCMNFFCHWRLASVRRNSGDKKYHSLEELGFLFQRLICPHFVAEMFFWLFYAALGATVLHWLIGVFAWVTLGIRTINNYFWYKEKDLFRKKDIRVNSDVTI